MAIVLKLPVAPVVVASSKVVGIVEVVKPLRVEVAGMVGGRTRDRAVGEKVMWVGDCRRQDRV